jgi:hypothetical protein
MVEDGGYKVKSGDEAIVTIQLCVSSDRAQHPVLCC